MSKFDRQGTILLARNVEDFAELRAEKDNFR